MNKMKKLFAVVISVVMACVFATCAFADTTSDVKAFMLAKGVTVTGTLTQEQAKSLAASSASLKSSADAMFVASQGSDLATVQANADAAAGMIRSLKGFEDLKVTVSAVGSNLVRVTATSGNMYAVGDVVVGTGSTASSSVIKATGDNSAVLMVVSLMTIVGVMALAVRKREE